LRYIGALFGMSGPLLESRIESHDFELAAVGNKPLREFSSGMAPTAARLVSI
jgi:ABC-type Na+ transport system ATPase subunit NatA